jgi:AcrR family transcriptional regulator
MREVTTTGADLPAMSPERAIEVGAALFAEKGYATTTTREISRALGITNGTFYYYFSSKEDLLVQICQNSLERIIYEATKAVEQADSPLEKLTMLIRAHVSTMLSQQELHKTMIIEIRALSGTNLELVVRRRDDYEALVLSVLAEAQKAGAIRRNASPNVLSLLLLNLLNWTIVWFSPTGPLTEQDIASEMVELFLEGARPR